jgi:ATP-dependent protease ClpP protease subunit
MSFLPVVERPAAYAPAGARPTISGRAGAAQVRNLAPAVVDSEGTATVRIYEEIDSWGWFGLSAEEFAATIDGLPRNTARIVARINSPGGDVFDGITIANTLRAHPAPVTVIVDGLAASIASVIALAGDELIMGPQSEFMIHDAWGIGRGNAADMHQLGDLLDHLSDNIAGAYASKGGGTQAEWRARMQAETWFSATETVEAGLADALDGAGSAAPAVAPLAASFDRTAFRYSGRTSAPAPTVGTQTHNPAAGPARAQAALIRAKRRMQA